VAKLTEYQKEVLSNAQNHDIWGILKIVVENEIELVSKQIANSPRHCPEDLTKDLTCLTIRRQTLEWLLSQPDQSRKELKRSNEGR